MNPTFADFRKTRRYAIQDTHSFGDRSDHGRFRNQDGTRPHDSDAADFQRLGNDDAPRDSEAIAFEQFHCQSSESSDGETPGLESSGAARTLVHQ